MIHFKIWQFGILESRWEKSPYCRASCRLYINLLLFFQISSRWGAIWWNHFLRNFIASCDELSELSWWMVELTLNGKYQPSTTNIRATTKIWNSPVPGIWLIAEFPSWRHLTWRSLQLRLTMLGDYEDDSLSLMNWWMHMTYGYDARWIMSPPEWPLTIWRGVGARPRPSIADTDKTKTKKGTNNNSLSPCLVLFWPASGRNQLFTG